MPNIITNENELLGINESKYVIEFFSIFVWAMTQKL